MNNTTSLIKYLLVLLLGLFVGIFIGSRAIHEYGNTEHLAKLSDDTNARYLSGNTSAAKESLRNYLDELNLSIESHESEIRALLLDKVLVLGRLAVLAGASGHSAEEKQLLDLAITACQKLKNKDCAGAGIRKWVNQIDASQRLKGSNGPDSQ